MANYKIVATGTADAAVISNAVRLLGFSARESAGTAAVASFILRDGTDATGDPVVFVELLADQSLNGDYGRIEGIEFKTGIFLDRVSGESQLTVFF